MKSLVVVFLFASFVASAAASTIIPANRPAKTVLLKGGDVHPVSGPMLAKTDLLMVDGKIARLGAGLTAPAGAEVIDVTGRRIYPGLISASTTIGLEEIGAVRATVDTAEIGAINPNAKTQHAFNPDSELIPVARANGLLTVHTTPVAASGEGPQAAGLIAGTSALMRLDGWIWEDMTVRARVGVHVYWPAPVEGRRGRSGGSSTAAEERRKAQIQSPRP